jgi:DNA polymerase-1
MRHHIYIQEDTYDIAILMKNSSFNKGEIKSNYIDPLVSKGVPENSLIAFTLEYNQDGKAPVKHIKEYLEKLLPVLEDIQTKYLYVTDSSYFKTLTGQAKADPHHGYVLPCKIKGYEHMSVVLGLNYQQLIYNPVLQDKLTLSLDTLASHYKGKYQAIGTGIIHSAWYPQTHQDIAQALQSLHQYTSLSCDIEAFSLRFNEAGIGTIAFAWDKHNGIAFACDYLSLNKESYHGVNSPNREVRKLLLKFFQTYKGDVTFHNSTYDVKVIIYVLWMQSLLDTQGLLTGLDVMTRAMQDTKIIAYLATNSTAGNVLGLKPLAHEFAGNWAVEDIKDIRKIPLDQLLQYNLVDALSTNYVKEKYYPIMVKDKQEDLYKDLMLPSLKLIMQIELTGMPLSKSKVQEVKGKLEAIQAKHLDVIQNSSLLKVFNLLLQTSEMEKANAKLKVKQHPLSKFADVAFNPNSGPQLQKLLYEQMGLPVLDLTDTGQPATGAETIEKLINHTTVPEYKDLLTALIGYGKVTKILSTFIPAFEKAIDKGTGDIVWLHGNFNLGGTVSGRLSSSDPNLQNLPAGSEYGELIKECFMAPEGWIFCGADFNSLEDMISALTTKDPNKLAVYTQGFDGHCLRAAYYFKDQCLDIDVTDVNSVNSMKKKYPVLRQDSKAPTFALTYQGTWRTLMVNLGWPEDKCKSIEANYHVMYKISDDYIQDRLKQASKDGYAEVAFGLRVRTPLLKQVMFGGTKMPYEAAAEGRTVGNAMGQSYGLLNNRAAVEFMNKVWNSPYRYYIKPVALIHDAIYILVKDDISVLEFANNELIKAMQWQELPEIQHPTVKLGAALDVFWPSWKHKTTLPNNADQSTIRALCKEAKDSYIN